MLFIKFVIVKFLLSSVAAQQSKALGGVPISLPFLWRIHTVPGDKPILATVRFTTSSTISGVEATATASNEGEIPPPVSTLPEPTSSGVDTDVATSGTSSSSATNTAANIEDATSSAASTPTPAQALSTHSSPPIGPIIGGVIGGIALLGAMGLAGLYIWRRTDKRDKRVPTNDADEEDMPELPPAEIATQHFPQEQKVELENVEKQRVEAPGDHEQLQQRQLETQSYSNPTFRHELA